MLAELRLDFKNSASYFGSVKIKNDYDILSTQFLSLAFPHAVLVSQAGRLMRDTFLTLTPHID